MRQFLFGLATTAILFVPVSRAADKDDGFTPLFNGIDLKGLKVQYEDKDKGADPAKTFTIKEGALIVSGKPKCYIYADKNFKNYVLQFDWRFPKDSTPDSNSGCLVHIQLPHKVMPKSVEPQGRYKDHGKLYAVGFKEGLESTFNEEAHKKALRPMGEWSTTEVTCKADGSITVKLNGVLVSTGKSPLTEGPIGFQCEGWEVHFKNIKIKELK
ncbi:MAG: DUF1080 domain-containing protein [Planctomycetes bacterium]|nr:DUF1080 domain-containing protein [Planctomycetota bacterium]